MKSGAEKAIFCMNRPATDEETAQEIFRPRLVTPLAKVRSSGRTTAATYDWRVGTSISTSDSRKRNRTMAHRAEGATEAAIRKMLDGRCVNTMVLISPIRRASA